MIVVQTMKNSGNLNWHLHKSSVIKNVTDRNQAKNEKTLDLQGF